MIEEKKLLLPEDTIEALKKFLVLSATPRHIVDMSIEIMEVSIKLMKDHHQEALQTQRQKIREKVKGMKVTGWSSHGMYCDCEKCDGVIDDEMEVNRVVDQILSLPELEITKTESSEESK